MLTTCLPRNGPVVNRIFLTISIIPRQQPVKWSELVHNYVITTHLYNINAGYVDRQVHKARFILYAVSPLKNKTNGSQCKMSSSKG
jgi:hypothetical protein